MINMNSSKSLKLLNKNGSIMQNFYHKSFSSTTRNSSPKNFNFDNKYKVGHQKLFKIRTFEDKGMLSYLQLSNRRNTNYFLHNLHHPSPSSGAVGDGKLDFQKTYGLIERNVMRRMNESNRVRFRIGLVASVGSVLWLLIFYGNEIKTGLASLIGGLATETMEDESLKVQTQELASAVVQTILKDSEVTMRAASFLKDAADTPETQQALLKLTWHILQHEETLAQATELGKNLIKEIVKDHDTINQFGYLLVASMNTKEFQDTLSKVMEKLSEEEEVQFAVQELMVKVFSHPQVIEATNELFTSTTENVMKDGRIADQSRAFLAEVVNDDRVQREGSAALWGTVSHAVKPSMYRAMGFTLSCLSVMILKVIYSPY